MRVGRLSSGLGLAFVAASGVVFLSGCSTVRRVSAWTGLGSTQAPREPSLGSPHAGPPGALSPAPRPVPPPGGVGAPPPLGLGPIIPPPSADAPSSAPFVGVPDDHLEPPHDPGAASALPEPPRVVLPPMPAGPRVAYRASADPDAAALPAGVLIEPARPWTVVVLHHSATKRGGVALFDPMHRARGWEGVGYDFVIGNGTDTGDGELEVTFRWREQRDGAHAKGWNDIAIGICLVGNYEETPPTPKQRETLVRLLRHLRRRFGIPAERVVGHKTLNPTLCPGRHFPLDAILRASTP